MTSPDAGSASGSSSGSAPGPTPEPVDTRSVEHVVRAQLAKALGGVRGMAEAAVPTLVFTVVFLFGKDLRLAVVCSVACAGVLLVVRLVQRQTPQFVLNALVGIGVGAFFAWRAARGGGDANDQALAYFLPGLIYNGVYSVLLVLSILTRWPVVGFVVGSVTGDPTGWREDPQVLRLCGRLTWLLAVPCVLRVVVQAPLYLAGRTGALNPDVAVGIIAGTKLAMGWPLQVAALLAMVWLLSRNKTPSVQAEVSRRA